MEETNGMKQGHQLYGDMSSEPKERKKWYEVKPKLLRLERHAMRHVFPNMQEGMTSVGEMLWQGPVVTAWGNAYQIQIRYPQRFPFVPPKAYMLDPEVWEGAYVKGDFPALLPAVFNDGSIRLADSIHDLAWGLSWGPTQTTASFMLWVCHWLNCYDVWQETGDWPFHAHEKLEINVSNRGVCEKLRDYYVSGHPTGRKLQKLAKPLISAFSRLRR